MKAVPKYSKFSIARSFTIIFAITVVALLGVGILTGENTERKRTAKDQERSLESSAVATAIASLSNFQFQRNLRIGLRNDPDVEKLHMFLSQQRFYSGPITGSFSARTRFAVKRFQIAHRIRVTGYWGPESRAAANVILQQAVQNPEIPIPSPVPSLPQPQPIAPQPPESPSPRTPAPVPFQPQPQPATHPLSDDDASCFGLTIAQPDSPPPPNPGYVTTGGLGPSEVLSDTRWQLARVYQYKFGHNAWHKRDYTAIESFPTGPAQYKMKFTHSQTAGFWTFTEGSFVDDDGKPTSWQPYRNALRGCASGSANTGQLQWVQIVGGWLLQGNTMDGTGRYWNIQNRFTKNTSGQTVVEWWEWDSFGGPWGNPHLYMEYMIAVAEPRIAGWDHNLTKRCVKSVSPGAQHYYGDLTDCGPDGKRWTIAVESEENLGASCPGPVNQSLPINDPASPMELHWVRHLDEFGRSNWSVNLKTDLDRKTHPCSSSKVIPSMATASQSLPENAPLKAADGDVATVWNAGGMAPQSIVLDLGRAYDISKIRLLTAQYPMGSTAHRVLGGLTPEALVLLKEFNGHTTDHQWLEVISPSPLRGIRYLKIETIESPSWVAWKEIEVYPEGNEGHFTWFAFMDHADHGGGPLPRPDQVTFSTVASFNDFVPNGATRAFAGWQGFWDGMSHAVEINFVSKNWADADPNPDVVKIFNNVGGFAEYITMDGQAMGIHIPRGVETKLQVDWYAIIQNLVSRGLMRIPTGGWQQSATQAVFIGTEVKNNTPSQSAVSDLWFTNFRADQK